jgi:Flp pilus assembly protein TadG
MKNHSSKATGERGTELVEFAFAITILLALVFGVIGFAQVAYAYHFVSHAAREATRYASVRGSACTLLPDCGIEPAGIATYVQDITPIGINKSSTTLIVTATWPATGGCPGPSNAPGCPVTVNVQYHFTYLPMLRLPPLNITSTSQMVISQ